MSRPLESSAFNKHIVIACRNVYAASNQNKKTKDSINAVSKQKNKQKIDKQHFFSQLK